MPNDSLDKDLAGLSVISHARYCQQFFTRILSLKTKVATDSQSSMNSSRSLTQIYEGNFNFV
jgi:hypothetical protein